MLDTRIIIEIISAEHIPARRWKSCLRRSRDFRRGTTCWEDKEGVSGIDRDAWSLPPTSCGYPTWVNRPNKLNLNVSGTQEPRVTEKTAKGRKCGQKMLMGSAHIEVPVVYCNANKYKINPPTSVPICV
jgi:hypothetical protein